MKDLISKKYKVLSDTDAETLLNKEFEVYF